MVKKKKDTPEDKKYWELAEKTAKKVAAWPSWKKGSVEKENMSLKDAIESVQKADTVLAFIGAGMSQESGIPTFRDEDGTFKDKEMENMLQKHVLDRNPEGFIKYFKKVRMQAFEGTAPNKGHYALADLSQKKKLLVVTQNIDGYTEKAISESYPETQVPIAYLHGSMAKMRCHKCFQDVSEASEMGDCCPHCGGVVRPDIVLYGEPLDSDIWLFAEEAAEQADVCLIIGTSGLVYPASSIPERASEEGATLIEINPGSTYLSQFCDITVRSKAGDTLEKIVREIT